MIHHSRVKQIFVIRKSSGETLTESLEKCTRASISSILGFMQTEFVVSSSEDGPCPPDYLSVSAEFSANSPLHIWLVGYRRQEFVFVDDEKEFWRIYFEAQHHKHSSIPTSLLDYSICVLGPSFEHELDEILKPKVM